jgi:hypothetical protein
VREDSLAADHHEFVVDDGRCSLHDVDEARSVSTAAGYARGRSSLRRAAAARGSPPPARGRAPVHGLARSRRGARAPRSWGSRGGRRACGRWRLPACRPTSGSRRASRARGARIQPAAACGRDRLPGVPGPCEDRRARPRRRLGRSERVG